MLKYLYSYHRIIYNFKYCNQIKVFSFRIRNILRCIFLLYTLLQLVVNMTVNNKMMFVIQLVCVVYFIRTIIINFLNKKKINNNNENKLNKKIILNIVTV